MTTAQAAATLVRLGLSDLLATESRVEASGDAESVHDMRVATRRLRAVIQTLREYLPDGLAMLTTDLKWLAALLGRVRDLDIAGGKIEEFGALSSSEASAKECILQALESERSHAYKELAAAIRSERYQSLVLGLNIAPITEESPILSAAPKLIKHRFKKLASLGKRMNRSPRSTQIHKVRIRAKRLRYVLDAFASLYGSRADQLIGRLQSFQDLLGARQDALTLASQLELLVEQEKVPLPARALCYKRSAQLRKEADDLMVQFERSFSRATGKRWSRLHAQMKALAKSQPQASCC